MSVPPTHLLLFASKNRKIIAAVGIICLLWIVGYWLLPPGIDWTLTYRPAALALLQGKSPFSIDIFYAAPWGLLPLVPFAILPEPVGRSGLFVAGALSFGIVAYRLGARPLSLGAFMVSPPVVHCLYNSNIEWLPLLGVLMPPRLGLFFVLIKPQIGLGIAVFWLYESWKTGGFRLVAKTFLPAGLTTLLSFALFGLWPLRFSETLALTQTYNASLWPASLPVGLVLLVAAFRLKNFRLSLAASPCLSPYTLLHSWVGALAAAAPNTAEMVAAVIGLWMLMLMRFLSMYYGFG